MNSGTGDCRGSRPFFRAFCWLSIALAEVATAGFWFRYFDYPDFYFRGGPPGVLFVLPFSIFVYSLVGVAAEALFRGSGHPVNSLWSSVAVIVSCTLYFMVVHYFVFAGRTIVLPFIHWAVVPVIYTVVGLLVSRMERPPEPVGGSGGVPPKGE